MPATTSIADLYAAHGDAIYGFLLSLSKDEHDARDTLQTLFLKLGESPPDLRRVRNHRAYLIAAARHLYIDLVRKNDTRNRYHDRFASQVPSHIDFESAPDPALARHLDRALAQLPSDQRAVLHLRVWEGMTFRQAADVLGISRATAVSRYRAAVDKLGALVSPELAAPSPQPGTLTLAR